MKITERIHAIKIPFQLTVWPGMVVERSVYVYLIYGKEVYLIDSGVASSAQVIFDYLGKTGRRPDEISTLVLTHSHPDHIGSAPTIKAATDCVVAAHEAEKSWVEDVELQFKERPVPSFHTIVEDSVKVDRLLKEGDILDLGEGLRLEVFHTPGHSMGSISLFLREDSALISGDAIPLLTEGPIYDDVFASISSIKKLRSIDNIDVLLSSWEDPRHGQQLYEAMDKSLDFLLKVHDAVKATALDGMAEPVELSKQTLNKLGFPEAAANPLVVRSFMASLKTIDNR